MHVGLQCSCVMWPWILSSTETPKLPWSTALQVVLDHIPTEAKASACGFAWSLCLWAALIEPFKEGLAQIYLHNYIIGCFSMFLFKLGFEYTF